MFEEQELTVEQVAREMQVHKSRVYSWIQTGELPAIDIGRRGKHNYRVSRADLEEFKQSRRTDRDRD
ncbi:MAG: helix-turn-helix domain-containing protein [Ktedonobacteraceae bacterium]|jgi:excisionase family DNA binding protein|nr:helix-turn-helix domain-containing protein [Ktedonobacteraceae bacterium]